MKLGRIPVFDSRSRNFPVRALVEAQEPRSWEWDVPLKLNQGQLSACVGFSWSHYLGSLPDAIPGISETVAVKVYNMAQILDEFPGENYEGTSVLAGIKATQALYPKVVTGYRWAFGLQDLILALGWVGPVVLGINWYSGMYDPDDAHIIRPTGRATGGHAILAIGVDLFNRVIRLHNSWGASWGLSGDCFISFDDMDRLLHEQGEACVPTGKVCPL